MCLTAVPAYLLARMLVSRRCGGRGGAALDRDPGDGVCDLDRARVPRLSLVHAGALFAVRAARRAEPRACGSGGRARRRRALGQVGVRRAPGDPRARRRRALGRGPRETGIPWRRIAIAAGALVRLRGRLRSARRPARPELELRPVLQPPHRAPGRPRDGRARDRARLPAGDLRDRVALAAGAGTRPRLPGVRGVPRRVDRDPLDLHRREVDLPRRDPPEADRGAEPLLPLAAPPARDGARARRAEGELAPRRRRVGARARGQLERSPHRRGAVLRGTRPRDPDPRRTATSAGTSTTSTWWRSEPSPSRSSVLAFRRRRWVAAGAASARRGVAPDRPDLRDEDEHELLEGLREPDPGAPRLGRRGDRRQARHLPGTGAQPRPDLAVGDGVLEPLASTTSRRSTAPRPARDRRPAPGSRPPTARSQGYTGDPYTLAGPGVRLAAPIVEAAGRVHAVPHADAVASARRGAERVHRRLGDLADGYTYFPRGGRGHRADRPLADGVHRRRAARSRDDPRRHGQAGQGRGARLRPGARHPPQRSSATASASSSASRSRRLR